ncbi:hypothetical protein D9613_008441 [Agrocybe pediades]|uniref:NmrA-like domain-containing protein n=1 Tax=Agrocybe pediades TaxID=84607 RepID=A0A8H4VNQ8_9AGAR|nr:hypothetical protein D9613_008441 [Agrocybe pediades]
MTILVLGGTGKTGGSLTKLLHEAGISFIVASRSGKAEPYKAVTFDWFNPSTFENPFNADSNIDKVYLVVPVAYYDIAPIVNPFIDLAISKGVKRIVLLTTLQTEPGVEPTFGAVHQYLASKDIEYAVLRPSWFMQNFAYNFYQSIRENNEVFSATGDGKIPWISTEDIAQAAFDTLTTPESIRKDLLIVGPELLTYDEAAKLLSSVLGREIKHKRHTSDEQVKAFSQFLSPEFSKLLVDMEVAVSQGFEESCLKEPLSRLYIGKHKLEDYFKANRNVWIK